METRKLHIFTQMLYYCFDRVSGRIIWKFSGGPYGECGAQAYNGGLGQSLN